MSAMAVGGAGAVREQALSLLAAANNLGDLSIKLSSLKQLKEVLLSAESSIVGEIFPYLVELQSSPHNLVRKALVEVMEESGLQVMEHASILIPALIFFLKDGDSIVAKQSIVSGTTIFCRVLEEMAVQFHRRGRVEKWLEDLWTWLVKFKDAVFAIASEPGSVKVKLLAVKLLETCVLLFSSDSNNSEKPFTEGNGSAFNVSWLVDGHPVLDPVALMSEANRTVGILLKLLQSASGLSGPSTIIVVNCLAAIGRRRPLYYGTILSALLEFDPNLDKLTIGHAASVQYSLRTAFLGFLRCRYPAILESRDRLLKALREMNAGDAAEQVIRQVDKLIKNSERASREARSAKDEHMLGQLPVSGDTLRKRTMFQDIDEVSNHYEPASKRSRHDPGTHSALTVLKGDYGQDNGFANGVSLKVPKVESELTPVEQMIAMIGALVGEGERGADSLEILISNIHPDLLADIVITNMKHLPKTPPPLTRLGNSHLSQTGVASSPEQIVAPTATSNYPVFSAEMPSTLPIATCTSFSDASNTITSADSKRDPRRDPRRLDPRRVADPIVGPSVHLPEDVTIVQSDTRRLDPRRMADPIVGPSVHLPEDITVVQSDNDISISLSKPFMLPGVAANIDNTSAPLIFKTNNDDQILERPSVSDFDQLINNEEMPKRVKDTAHVPDLDASSDLALSPARGNDEGSVESMSTNMNVLDGADISSMLGFDQYSPEISNTSISEEDSNELPLVPSYVDLTEEQQVLVKKLTVERIIESDKNLSEADNYQTRMALLARLVAQTEADDDLVIMLQDHIVSAYQIQKGHELVLHVLYHLHAVMISDSLEWSSSAAVTYEKILLAVAKSLLEKLPASDKSFSRLLGEVPLLPTSVLKLLEDLCYSDVVDCNGNIIRESDRVTQGLGAVWSLILGRPLNRQACLNISLKSAVHLQDEIRAKAIRLVANKLYLLSYISGNIEEFATDMLLKAVDQRSPEIELAQSVPCTEQKTGEDGTQETSTSGSQNSENKDVQSIVQGVSTKSFSEAQCFISLFFALCTKKPSLLQLVFSVYGRAPKAVKQAVHRHIPILIRSLRTSNSELLRIISDPPQGSENLLSLVLQILTEDTTPSSELIATVKYLYDTKLKDASILIPMLSSLSKKEVLPIFPRLVDLPLEKFQKALAHILQGSAHTGPALTPTEVLVAIHDISPEKDGVPLKKITDVCSACFEQRMVFTQQVLAKALNEMVDRNHLPLLFMRTVIQAIDAYPKLVDCVMEILSKLVIKQVWKMPKLWVGFLKCISQTQPHSFNVLLQLPLPQLENALNKHARLRGPLAAYANQPSIRSSLPRSTLVVLGLANESQIQQPHLTSLHPSDTKSSVHKTTLT